MPPQQSASNDDSFDDSPAPEEFYYEGPYVVFTAAYHLRRGFCCHSGCRHCPYDAQAAQAADRDGSPA